MGDEHLDTIPETESDEFIKSSVEDLVPIQGMPAGYSAVDVCDDDVFLHYGGYRLCRCSPSDDEFVSLEVVEIVTGEVGRIDDEILLTIKAIITTYSRLVEGSRFCHVLYSSFTSSASFGEKSEKDMHTIKKKTQQKNANPDTDGKAVKDKAKIKGSKDRKSQSLKSTSTN
ncbi:hypothetical protein Tco_1123182 [Tanacetum coccineum]|uniref:Uncharacterized protein n=1 Tax=Tanacetum coccineum TaxID=301880 RepID=A0ABQ5J5G6_9ASTR